MERSFNDQVELMIDNGTLAGMLSTIAQICHEKAAHIRENWQDDATAKPWALVAKRIETIEAVAREAML